MQDISCVGIPFCLALHEFWSICPESLIEEDFLHSIDRSLMDRPTNKRIPRIRVFCVVSVVCLLSLHLYMCGDMYIFM